MQPPVCSAEPEPVCAGRAEPCILDYSCETAGGLGCNAGGHPACRFCGFGPFNTCPGMSSTQVVQSVEIASCPAACTSNPAETCFYEPECASGGVGCNAGGINEICRFCGFGLFIDLECPDTSTAEDDLLINLTGDLAALTDIEGELPYIQVDVEHKLEV